MAKYGDVAVIHLADYTLYPFTLRVDAADDTPFGVTIYDSNGAIVRTTQLQSQNLRLCG